MGNKGKPRWTPGPFRVAPTAVRGHSLIQWDMDEGGPRRSLQAETEVVTLWAAAPQLYEALDALTAEVFDLIGRVGIREAIGSATVSYLDAFCGAAHAAIRAARGEGGEK